MEIDRRLETKALREAGTARQHEGPTTEAAERAKAAERARGRLEEFTGALEGRAGEMLGDAEMFARGRARELRGQLRQRINR